MHGTFCQLPGIRFQIINERSTDTPNDWLTFKTKTVSSCFLQFRRVASKELRRKEMAIARLGISIITSASTNVWVLILISPPIYSGHTFNSSPSSTTNICICLSSFIVEGSKNIQDFKVDLGLRSSITEETFGVKDNKFLYCI